MTDWLALVLIICFATFVGLSLHDLRLDTTAVQGRIVAIEEKIKFADEFGSSALHKHERTPVSRAHPLTNEMTCPVCPPCER